MHKFLILFAVFVAACSAGQAEVEISTARAVPAVKALRVETARIADTPAKVEISVPGEVQGSRDARLAAAQGGFIEAVFVKTGMDVRKGQALVQVDAATYSAAYDQARAQSALAAAELERRRGLGDLASASQLHAAETQAAVAAAGERMAGVRLSRAIVTAPFDGVVSDVTMDVGEVAPPGAMLVRLTILDPITVTLSVPDRDVVGLREGMRAQVSTSASAGVLTGVIDSVSPAADYDTRSFPVEVEVANPDRALLPGMIARVHIEGASGDGAMVLPQDWLVTRGAEPGVFVIEGDAETEEIARWEAVTLGRIIRNQVVITGGLTRGDRVVINGQRGLVDGDQLLVTREGTCCRDGRAFFGDAQ